MDPTGSTKVRRTASSTLNRVVHGGHLCAGAQTAPRPHRVCHINVDRSLSHSIAILDVPNPGYLDIAVTEQTASGGPAEEQFGFG